MNEAMQISINALRTIINSGASANPAFGKIGEILSRETVIRKLKKASIL